MKNTPPHVKLSLPDGSRLTAVPIPRRTTQASTCTFPEKDTPKSSSALWSSTGNGKLAKTSASACTSRMWMTPCITNRTV